MMFICCIVLWFDSNDEAFSACTLATVVLLFCIISSLNH